MHLRTSLFLLIAALLLWLGAGHWQASAPVPSLASATQTIQRIAASPESIRLTRHARERMDQRDISMEEIREALMHGELREAPRVGKEGDLLYKMYYRRAEIVVSVEGEALLVITAMRDE